MDTPHGLGPRGLDLWESVAGAFDLDVDEAALLAEACRVADRLDDLDAEVRSRGVLVDTPNGPRANPALVEARQQEITLTRLVASLRIPDADTDARPQRRGSARGAYAARRDYGSRSVAA